MWIWIRGVSCNRHEEADYRQWRSASRRGGVVSRRRKRSRAWRRWTRESRNTMAAWNGRRHAAQRGEPTHGFSSMTRAQNMRTRHTATKTAPEAFLIFLWWRAVRKRFSDSVQIKNTDGSLKTVWLYCVFGGYERKSAIFIYFFSSALGAALAAFLATFFSFFLSTWWTWWEAASRMKLLISSFLALARAREPS